MEKGIALRTEISPVTCVDVDWNPAVTYSEQPRLGTPRLLEPVPMLLGTGDFIEAEFEEVGKMVAYENGPVNSYAQYRAYDATRFPAFQFKRRLMNGYV